VGLHLVANLNTANIPDKSWHDKQFILASSRRHDKPYREALQPDRVGMPVFLVEDLHGRVRLFT
jgi:hypothetical protein